MAESLRRIKTRIKSIQGVKKLTRAMEMVSTAKLKPLEREFNSCREYFLRLESLLNNILVSFSGVNNSLLRERPNKKNILLCIVTSDTGLCGAYNNNIIHAAKDFINKNSSLNVSVLPVGRKGLNYFKKNGSSILSAYTEFYGHYSNELIDKIAWDLIDAFSQCEADEVYMVYTNFISVSKNRPVVEKILNIEPKGGQVSEYIVEPDINSILEQLLLLYIRSKVRDALLGALTAENSNRVIAMHEATRNATDLLDDLVLLRNKVRQAAITSEVIEVIATADALKG